jgi:alginate O-acetyltransferase complex protein AlgJ
MKDRYPFFLIVLFLGILLIPLRTLVFDPAAIEESFYGRGYLINLITNLRLKIGDRVFPKVIVGENGWLIFTGEADILDYQKAEAFTEEELATFQADLDALSANYAARGITLLVVVVPNKNTIYPERVPSQIEVLGRESRLEQIVSYLQAHGQTQILDLRPMLRAAKPEHEIYYATDTHWNGYGAYLAYSSILNKLQETFPKLAPRPASDFKVVEREPEALDLAANIGTTLLAESRIQFVPQFDQRTNYKSINLGGRRLMLSYNADASLPDLVIYYDSFFFTVNPMLGEHFHQGAFVQNYSGSGLWNLSWVDERQPDIVIIEFNERYLEDLPTFISPNR